MTIQPHRQFRPSRLVALFLVVIACGPILSNDPVAAISSCPSIPQVTGRILSYSGGNLMVQVTTASCEAVSSPGQVTAVNRVTGNRYTMTPGRSFWDRNPSGGSTGNFAYTLNFATVRAVGGEYRFEYLPFITSTSRYSSAGQFGFTVSYVAPAPTTFPPTTVRPVVTLPPTTVRPVVTLPPTTVRPVVTLPPTTVRPVVTLPPTTLRPVLPPPTISDFLSPTSIRLRSSSTRNSVVWTVEMRDPANRLSSSVVTARLCPPNVAQTRFACSTANATGIGTNTVRTYRFSFRLAPTSTVGAWTPYLVVPGVTVTTMTGRARLSVSR
jgi:hypothetical protein